MKTLVIGFSRAKSPWKLGSKAIQLSEKRDFGHAYVSFLGPISQTPLIAQASHGMVNIMNKRIFEESNIIVKEYRIEATDEQYIKFISFICENLGKPYSTTQIFLIAIKKILKFEIKEYNKDKYYICSEFAAKLCEILGIEVPQELDYFTPSDLDTLLHNNNVEVIHG